MQVDLKYIKSLYKLYRDLNYRTAIINISDLELIIKEIETNRTITKEKNE